MPRSACMIGKAMDTQIWVQTKRRASANFWTTTERLGTTSLTPGLTDKLQQLFEGYINIPVSGSNAKKFLFVVVDNSFKCSNNELYCYDFIANKKI